MRELSSSYHDEFYEDDWRWYWISHLRSRVRRAPQSLFSSIVKSLLLFPLIVDDTVLYQTQLFLYVIQYPRSTCASYPATAPHSSPISDFFACPPARSLTTLLLASSRAHSHAGTDLNHHHPLRLGVSGRYMSSW